jgi:hypothetical protein
MNSVQAYRHASPSAEAECISDPAHCAGAVNRHYIETDARLAPLRIFGKQYFRRAQQTPALARPQGFCGGCEAAPCLHFHKNRQAVPFNNCIDFTGRGAHPPAHDRPSVTYQRFACQAFGGQPGRRMGLWLHHRGTNLTRVLCSAPAQPILCVSAPHPKRQTAAAHAPPTNAWEMPPTLSPVPPNGFIRQAFRRS